MLWRGIDILCALGMTGKGRSAVARGEREYGKGLGRSVGIVEVIHFCFTWLFTPFINCINIH